MQRALTQGPVAHRIGDSPGHGRPATPNSCRPVGATIVAETLVGLIELDEASWLGEDRNWTPDSGESGLGISTVGGLLTYAGTVPAVGTP